MRNLLYLLVVFSLISCDTSTKKTTLSPTENNVENINKTEQNANNLNKNIEQLQGVWKRQSYPYGTIEFKGTQVKYTEGEGSPEPPKFQDFKLNRTCEGDSNGLTKEMYDFGITTAQYCEAIKLNDDTFEIFYGKGETGVIYKRKVESNADSFTDHL